MPKGHPGSARPSQHGLKWRIRPLVDGTRVSLTFATLSEAEAALAVISANRHILQRSRCVLCGAEKKYAVEDGYGLGEG